MWRPLTPKRNNPQHRCTTTIHPVYNCSKKIVENLLPVWLLVCTNLFIPSRFLDYTKFDNCCLRYIATCGKKWYRCTSTFPALNYPVEFSSNLSAIYRKSCAKPFPPIFGLFEIFDHNFAKLVAASSNSNQNYLVHLKLQSMLKKAI